MLTAPSNNVWRLSGALGVNPDPTPASGQQEVLTQGLGFPLRPVDNVPAPDDPNIPDGLVAEGLLMQWMGNWQAGIYYPKGAYVRDGDWTLVANKLTLDKPAPVPDPADPASYGLSWVAPGPPPATASNISQVVSGQTYTFLQDGWIKELRIWVPEVTANTSYRVVVINLTDPENPELTTIENPPVVADDWSLVALLDLIVKAGAVLRIELEALTSGASSSFSGDWFFEGNTIADPSTLGRWNKTFDNTEVKVNIFDTDSGNRAADLLSATPGTILTVSNQPGLTEVNTTFRIDGLTSNPTFVQYDTTFLTQDAGIIVPNTTYVLSFDVPVAQATEYAEETAVWGTPPSWASSVESFLRFDDVDQGAANTTAYGVDILFEPAEVSEDWDIVSFTG